MFRRLVCLGSFPACWFQANVTPIPKGPPSSSERLVSVRLGRFMEIYGSRFTVRNRFTVRLGRVVSFQQSSLLIGKVWVPVMHFCACPIHCRVHWRVGRRLGSCRLTSVQLLIWSTIWAFSISSALSLLEVLSCLY